MRILYNSKDSAHKLPFGTLTEGQKCNMNIHIPSSCLTREVSVVLLRENKTPYRTVGMSFLEAKDGYDIYTCEFSLDECALYFYYFCITTQNERFSLYREGYDQTNMEAGELWQVSVIPADFHVPSEYFGAVMYQIFPDRFHAEGQCDATGKLEPFFIHADKSDLPCYLPDEKGEVRNCDFFGGNLKGITEKLDYLGELGVKVIYLNPIFKAYSNHRYDTADYLVIDELLGNEQDLVALCDEAHKKGMRVILDGVFSHTGSNSRYFDKDGVFGEGAYQKKDSPYRSWFDFKEWPDNYTSWWGIDTLPCVNEMDESYLDFIIENEDSVLAHWVRAGVDGFRFDVADELPDAFIAAFRKRLKGLKPDALLLGEVWEDASNKISYGERRRYFTGGELDSVMNYPFRNAILEYICGRDDGSFFARSIMTIAENYPSEVLLSLMNMLSTHDTPRILSLLSPDEAPMDKSECAGYRMSDGAREVATVRLRAATFMQFVLPGMPCVFYGDEIGTEGMGDPFCRSYFDWNRAENNPLREFFAKMGEMRGNNEALKYGKVSVEHVADGVVAIERATGEARCRATVNVGEPRLIEKRGEIILSERATENEGAVLLDKYGFILENL